MLLGGDGDIMSNTLLKNEARNRIRKVVASGKHDKNWDLCHWG